VYSGLDTVVGDRKIGIMKAGLRCKYENEGWFAYEGALIATLRRLLESVKADLIIHRRRGDVKIEM